MVNVFTAFAMVFIAEMGDKTQLFLIGLSSKFKLKSIIIGVAAAIAVLNGAAVAEGKGNTKRLAEADAAKTALERLIQDGKRNKR